MTARFLSLFDAGFSDLDSELIWEEGMHHLLETDLSLRECRRLLKSGGHLVMHETNVWFEEVRETFASLGFTIRTEHPLLSSAVFAQAGGQPMQRVLLAAFLVTCCSVSLSWQNGQILAIGLSIVNTLNGVVETPIFTTPGPLAPGGGSATIARKPAEILGAANTHFGNQTVEPAFFLNGAGTDIDSLAFWESAVPEETLLFVSGKANNDSEVAIVGWETVFHTTGLSLAEPTCSRRHRQSSRRVSP